MQRYIVCLLLLCLPLQSLVVAAMPVQMLTPDTTTTSLPMPCHEISVSNETAQACDNCSLCHLFRATQVFYISLPHIIYHPVQNPISQQAFTSFIPEFPERPPQY